MPPSVPVTPEFELLSRGVEANSLDKHLNQTVPKGKAVEPADLPQHHGGSSGPTAFCRMTYGKTDFRPAVEQ